jgi:WD40 repeat protein
MHPSASGKCSKRVIRIDSSGKATTVGTYPKAWNCGPLNHAYWLGPRGRILITQTIKGLAEVGGREWAVEGRLSGLVISPDERYLATRARIGSDTRVQLWDLSAQPSPKPRHLQMVGTPSEFAWSVRGDALLVSTLSGSPLVMRVVRFPLAGEARVVLTPKTLGTLRSRHQAPDRHVDTKAAALFVEESGLHVLGPKAKVLQRVAFKKPFPYGDIEWSPDLRRVALRSARPKDGGHSLLNIDLSTGSIQEENLPRTHTLWWSPRGTYLSAAGRESVWISRAGQGRVVFKAAGETVNGFTWSPDESYLIVALTQRVLRVPLGTDPPTELLTTGAGTMIVNPNFDAEGRLILTVLEGLER